MPADIGGDGLEAMPQVIELDDDSRQGVCLAITVTSLLDDGAKLGVPVEGRLGDPGATGDGGEGDEFSCTHQFGAS